MFRGRLLDSLSAIVRGLLDPGVLFLDLRAGLLPAFDGGSTVLAASAARLHAGTARPPASTADWRSGEPRAGALGAGRGYDGEDPPGELTSSSICQSNMPTRMKSAPLLKAKRGRLMRLSPFPAGIGSAGAQSLKRVRPEIGLSRGVSVQGASRCRGLWHPRPELRSRRWQCPCAIGHEMARGGWSGSKTAGIVESAITCPKNHANLRHVRELLGHRSLAPTERYLRLTPAV